jgi:hypothetical protein
MGEPGVEEGTLHGLEVVHALVPIEEERLTEGECPGGTPRPHTFDDVVTAEIRGDISIEVWDPNARDSIRPQDPPALPEESDSDWER